MQVIWQKLIQVLSDRIIEGSDGIPWQYCPFHSKTPPSLEVSKHPVTGMLYFACKNDKCGFRGDVITLVAALHKCDVEAALNMFRVGGPYNGTLVQPDNGVQLNDYLVRLAENSEIDQYLTKCANALRTTMLGANIRTALAECLPKSTRDFPLELGVFLGDQLPAGLLNLRISRANRKECLLFPYTYDRICTHIVVRPVDPDKCQFEHNIVPQQGMLFESMITPDAGQLFICQSEMDALALIKRFHIKHATVPPVTVVRGLPLPQSCKDVKRIVMLSTPTNPIPLHAALEYLVAEQTVHGYAIKPKIVVAMTQNIKWLDLVRKTNSFEIENSVAEYELGNWILRELDREYTRGNIGYILRSLDRFKLTQPLVDDLLRRLRQKKVSNITITTENLLSLLDDVSKQAQSTFVLANRKQLRQTPAGITTIKPLGEEVLSNVMIQIPEKVLMRDRSVYYNCTLSSPEWGQPITMLLPESAFVHNVDLQQTVQKQLNLMGINTYVAFYDHPGYKWRDIAYCLSQRAVLKTELSALGSAPAFLLHLPRITIGPTRIDDQKHIFTMPKKATDMYSGLVVDLDDSADFRDPWIKLAEAAHKNSYIAGFLACIAHVVACMMAGAVATAEEWTLNTKHLLIVEPEAGVWLPVFQQVADLFSGGVPIPKLTLDRQLNHKLIKAFECMGDLPCAVRLHIPHGSRLSDMQLDTLPTSLVSIVDEAVAADATANPSISFVYPKNLPGDLTLLHAEDLALLRKTFPKFMQFMLKYLRTKHEAGSSIFLDMVKTLVPAHLGYQCMCEALQIECKTEVIEDTVHRMFTGGFSADIFEFFDRLYKKIYVHRRVTDHDYRMLDEDPTMNEINVTRSPYITVTPRYVFIRKSICQYKSFRATLGDFNSTILEEELTANNLLDMTTDLNVDRRRYWVLSRETWDKFVSKPQTTYMSMSANPGGPTKIYRLAG